MMQLLTHVLTASFLASAAFAQPPVTTRDFAGTWNIEVASHQVALVIEVKDDTHVTATMMMMGRDLPLEGQLTGRTLTLVGVKSPATSQNGEAGSAVTHGGSSPSGSRPPAKPITVTLEDDGTISGEMMTTQGPAKWTGERLRTRKG